MRRLITVLVVAVATCAATLWWLHDGDLREAMEPVLVDWDATTLARDAGVAEDPAPARPATPEEGAAP